MDFKLERRKNSQFRQINTVTPHGVVCPVRLLHELRKIMGSDLACFMFKGCNGRLVAKNPGKTQPCDDPIKYGHVLHYFSSWFSGVLGVASSSAVNQVKVAGHPPLLMRGLPWSYGVSMEHGTLSRPKSVTWRGSGVYFIRVKGYMRDRERASYKRPATDAAG